MSDLQAMNFRLGSKNNQDNQIQHITLCSIYFSKNKKEIYTEAGEFSRIFVARMLSVFICSPYCLIFLKCLFCV